MTTHMHINLEGQTRARILISIILVSGLSICLPQHTTRLPFSVEVFGVSFAFGSVVSVAFAHQNMGLHQSLSAQQQQQFFLAQYLQTRTHAHTHECTAQNMIIWMLIIIHGLAQPPSHAHTHR